jgi:putative NIF3 family GTP cyclohydrolase 1 type 2
MKIRAFNVINESLFPTETLSFFNDGEQFGFNNFIDQAIYKIGYAINLTVDIIEQAKNEEVDLILTHHNCWDEMLEMVPDTMNLLKKYGITHYFNHLPLDASKFGPTRMLAKELGVTITDVISTWGDHAFGVVGEYDEAIELTELERLLDIALGHKSRVYKHNDRPIKRVGIVAGSAGDPASIHEAVLANCDAYITGEKKMKSIVYSQHVGINFLLGSHIFTERAGIAEYARRLAELMPELTFIPLVEEHIE